MSILPVLFACLPATLLLVATFLLPIVSTLRLSFSEWPGVGPVEWVGLKKYSKLVVNPDFHSSIKVTIVFSILSTIGVMGTALLMGLAASRKRRSDEPYVRSGFFQLLLQLPQWRFSGRFQYNRRSELSLNS